MEQRPYRILLMLSEQRDADPVVEAAIAEAKEKRDAGRNIEFTLAFVHEGKKAAQARRSIKSQSFLGRKATDQVLCALESEQQLLAMERTRDVQAAAGRAGFDIEVLSGRGSFRDAIVDFASEQKYDVIYMARSRWRGLREMWHEWNPVVRYARQEEEG
jgi:nucleotide-binding universal stress UspA family protein